MFPNFDSDISRISSRAASEWPESDRYVIRSDGNNSRVNTTDYINSTISNPRVNSSRVNTSDYMNSTISNEPWENILNNSTWIDPNESSRISNPNISRTSDQGISEIYPLYRTYRDAGIPMRGPETDYFRGLRRENQNRYLNRLETEMNERRGDQTRGSLYDPDETTSTFASQSGIFDRNRRNIRNASNLWNPSINNSLNDSMASQSSIRSRLNDTTMDRDRISKISQAEKDRIEEMSRRENADFMRSLYRPEPSGPLNRSNMSTVSSSRGNSTSLFRPATEIEKRREEAEIGRLERWRSDIRRKFGDDDDNRDYIRWSGRQAYDNDAIDFSTIAGVPKKRVKTNIVPQFV